MKNYVNLIKGRQFCI